MGNNIYCVIENKNIIKINSLPLERSTEKTHDFGKFDSHSNAQNIFSLFITTLVPKRKREVML